MATWAAQQGFKVLIFDTKDTGEEYTGFGKGIPVCLRESTDPFVLIGLLESIFRRRLTRYYATLTRVTEGAKDFDDIIENARELESKTRSSWLKDACRVLYDLLERLKGETRKVETVSELELHNGINRMVINEFSLEAQQLIMKNAFEDALRMYKRDLILVLDEAFKFIPQGYSSAATQAIMQVITQGGRTRLFTWIATQFLAVTDKDPLKACAFKFLGTQDHVTEVKHTLDLVPEAKGRFTSDDVMKLKVGHWILVRKRPPDVRVVYSAPVGIPVEEAGKVAKGELSPENVRDSYLKKMEEETELVWKERYEELKRELERVKDRDEAIREQNEEMRKAIAEFRTRTAEPTEQLKADNKFLQNRVRELEEWKAKCGGLTECLEKAEGEYKQAVEHFSELKDKLKIESREAASKVDIPSEISVTTEQPKISVKVERKPLNLTDKDLRGKIAIIYSEGALGDGWFSVSDVVKAFQTHAWKRDPRISTVLDEFTKWGYFEKKYAGRKPIYHVKMKLEDAKAKGFLKVED